MRRVRRYQFGELNDTKNRALLSDGLKPVAGRAQLPTFRTALVRPV